MSLADLATAHFCIDGVILYDPVAFVPTLACANGSITPTFGAILEKSTFFLGSSFIGAFGAAIVNGLYFAGVIVAIVNI